MTEVSFFGKSNFTKLPLVMKTCEISFTSTFVEVQMRHYHHLQYFYHRY